MKTFQIFEWKPEPARIKTNTINFERYQGFSAIAWKCIADRVIFALTPRYGTINA